MRYLVLGLKGILIGATNVVPGISGATIAVILGIFDDLIGAVNGLMKDLKKSLLFLIPVGLGMVIGILSLGTLIDHCLKLFSFQTCSLLAGLVLGSVPLIYRKATAIPCSRHCEVTSCDTYEAIHNSENSNVQKHSKKSHYTLLILGIIVVIIMSLNRPETIATQDNNHSMAMLAYLFFGGMLGAGVMIVPGISGAFVLMLIGLYPKVLGVIVGIKDYLLSPTDLSLLPPILWVVIPMGIGGVLGVILISKLLAVLLNKYYSATYFTILGLIIGTLFAIYTDPITYQSYDGSIEIKTIIRAIVCFIVGMMTVIILGKKS
jgi:putative membrane protein